MTTAVFILNRAPTKALKGVMPFEAWYGCKPSVSFLKTFGCIGHIKKTKLVLTKLEDRSTPMVLLGYEEEDTDSFKHEMMALFQMSDLDAVSYYLGIEINGRDRATVFVSPPPGLDWPQVASPTAQTSAGIEDVDWAMLEVGEEAAARAADKRPTASKRRQAIFTLSDDEIEDADIF
ncbi:uncharacterized protein [Miscanthus floridulus]|uniref:uncharacterized protein n=1 Tax=Miscanthus floridulus TaxID=154761 RepID=UPI0034578B3A